MPARLLTGVGAPAGGIPVPNMLHPLCQAGGEQPFDATVSGAPPLTLHPASHPAFAGEGGAPQFPPHVVTSQHSLPEMMAGGGGTGLDPLRGSFDSSFAVGSGGPLGGHPSVFPATSVGGHFPDGGVVGFSTAGIGLSMQPLSSMGGQGDESDGMMVPGGVASRVDLMHHVPLGASGGPPGPVPDLVTPIPSTASLSSMTPAIPKSSTAPKRKRKARHQKGTNGTTGNKKASKAAKSRRGGKQSAGPGKTSKGQQKAKHECDICGKIFSNNGNRNRHRTVHSGDRPFKCELCGKTFSQRSHVSTHQTVHTGEKQYECHICNRRFSQKAHLAGHLGRHERDSHTHTKAGAAALGRKSSQGNGKK